MAVAGGTGIWIQKFIYLKSQLWSCVHSLHVTLAITANPHVFAITN